MRPIRSFFDRAVSGWIVLIVALTVVALHSQTALARAPEHVCDSAAVYAASKTKVPLAILKAITRVETGRASETGIQPWPWTVNMEGSGAWFDNRDRALSFVFNHFQNGARSFDVGCFQINYRWHSAGFASIDEMFDPRLNALYAARFLERLHQEFGAWEAAIGAYHSRTSAHADRYHDRFEEVLAKLETPEATFTHIATDTDDILPRARQAEVPRTNAAGSLVPLTSSSQAGPFALFTSPELD